MFATLLSTLKSNPITTISGWLALGAGWVSQQPELVGHPTGKQLLQALGAACAALFAAVVADGKKQS